MEKKKSLGQHFLNSKRYLSLIADSAHLTSGDIVLEIGPGEGSLTRELLSRGARVTAVEKDRRLIAPLERTFAPNIHAGTLQLTEGDALLFEPAALGAGPYKLVANIPYYITGALLQKFLSTERQPSHIVLLVQKEVAARIARSTKESILSLSVKAYGTPRYIKTVPSGAFSPPPEVDSAILSIEHVSRNNFASPAHEEKFFALVRAGFAQKRKLLKRNLEAVLGAQAAAHMKKCGIPENARAEDVPLVQWLALAASD